MFLGPFERENGWIFEKPSALSRTDSFGGRSIGEMELERAKILSGSLPRILPMRLHRGMRKQTFREKEKLEIRRIRLTKDMNDNRSQARFD